MAATRLDIQGWLTTGHEKKATHVIVVVDTFDHEDYPVYVMAEENVRDRYEEFNGKNMQRVMEVYNLSLPDDEQLAQKRVFNF